MTRPHAHKCTICHDQRVGRLGAWRCGCGNVRLVSGFYIARAGNQSVVPVYEHHPASLRAVAGGVHCRTEDVSQ